MKRPSTTTLRPFGLASNERRLFGVQAFHSFGESLFALSLVGSLFFNVSVDAARPRILLYLAVTMAPFAVLGPLIGPAIDRIRGGHRFVLAVSLLGRAAIALLLASQLTTLLFYPEAFVILVGAKVYAVARNSLVPSLLTDHDKLMLFNAQVARVGTIAGLAGGAVGVTVLRYGGAPWTLRSAAVVYGIGGLAAFALPTPTVVDTQPLAVETEELHGRTVLRSAAAMAAIRLATGFIVFHVGFALKRSGASTVEIGSVAAAIAVGGFLGTFTAPHFRKNHDEERLLTGAVVGLALVTAVVGVVFAWPTAALLSLSLGLAGSVGRRAFDGVVQTCAPHARRGQAFAGLETRLEIAWVVGALAAVATRAPASIGLAGLASVLVLFGWIRRQRERRIDRSGSG